MILVILLAGALLLVSAGWVYAARRFEPTAVAGLAPAGDGPLNVLVVHAESETSTEPLSIAILQTRDGGEPRLLSLPLDLEVTVPGSQPAPLREVLSSGGRDGLVASVTDYTGIDLHHFVRLNLDGLERLAELADGPSCPGGKCLDEQLATFRREGAVRLELVPEHLSTLQAVGREATRTGNLVSPVAAKRLVDAVPAAVSTDVELGPRRSLRLARGLAAADVGTLDLRAVPGFHDPETGETTPYWEQAETLFQGFRDGTALPADLGRDDPTQELLVPERIRVLVLNGVGVPGLAGRVADHLAAAGFEVVGADNVDEFDDALAASLVGHRPDRPHEGELVGRKLGGGELVERSDIPRGADVVVIVGRDWIDR